MGKLRNKSEDKKVCPKCHGTGFIITERGAEPCECREEQLYQERLRQARIPQKFLAKSLDSFVARDKLRNRMVSDARDFINTFNPKAPEETKGLILKGPTGSGKTHIATAILTGVVKKGYSGVYYNVTELLKDLRETYSRDSEEVEANIIGRAGEVDLLVLDDLGSEATSGWVRDRLYLIINRRYENLKPLIVTTNLEPDELTKQVGDRITSRIEEMCHTYDFPAEDYRRKKMHRRK